VVLLRNIGEQG